MKKIKYFPEVKENYVAYHKILWQAIIDRIKKRGFDLNWDDANDIKNLCFREIFSFSVEHDCFGCQYSNGATNVKCKLFNSVCGCGSKCLNRYWRRFEDEIDNNEFEDAIKYARKIKNFPVRK